MAGAGQLAHIASGAVCKKGDKTFRAPPREPQALGRAPPAQGTASCPTERRPAPSQGFRKPPSNKLTQQVALEAFRTMNLPEELMQQLQATLAPPALPEIPAKRLLDLQIKLGKAEKERERLTIRSSTEARGFDAC